MDALSTQIGSRKFDTVKRGYDPQAVDSYLAKIGDQVGKLEDALRVARTRADELEHRRRDVHAANTVVKTAFLAAADSKAKLIEEAEARAAEIIREAEARASAIAGATEARVATAVPAAPSADAAAAEAMLMEARRRLEESERVAAARRAAAEREAEEILAAAKTRVADAETTTEPAEAAAAADELSRLVNALGALKEAARQGLEQAASLEADIEAVIGEG